MNKTENIIYAIDRLINKPVRISCTQETVCTPKQRIIYKDEKGKDMVATVLGYTVDAEKKGRYVMPLEGGEETMFEQNQEKAAELFKTFKQLFRKAFPESKPISARMNLSGNHIYFYFFAETRFDFSEFVKGFRQEVGMNFFLYQVGARDRVRLHPNLEEWYDPSGLPLMYHVFAHTLPNVNGDTVSVQQLGGRNNDRLKDRSGKLDHTLNFEKDFYKKESKRYPQHGQIFSLEGKRVKCTGYNMLTGEIHGRAKGDDDKSNEGRRHGEFQKTTLDHYEKEKQQNKEKRSTPPKKMIKESKTKDID